MRWILPLLSFALAPLAFGDIAVYVGNTTTQASGGSDSSIKSSRSIQVIDLATGKYRAVVFNGAVRNNSFTVSDEAQYTIAKTADRRLQTSTSFAEAGTGAGADQSTEVSSTLLQGRDSGVFLQPGVKTQWPRLIAGAGFDLATAGVGAADQPTPALVSKSFFTLTLDATESQTANAGTDTLDTIANRVAQSIVRTAIARFEAANTHSGHFFSGGVINLNSQGAPLGSPGAMAGGVSGGTLTLGSGGVIKTGTGTITFTPTPGGLGSGATIQIGGGSTTTTNVGGMTNYSGTSGSVLHLEINSGLPSDVVNVGSSANLSIGGISLLNMDPLVGVYTLVGDTTSGGLVKTGAGTLTVDGSNSYTGPGTAVGAGSFSVTGPARGGVGGVSTILPVTGLNVLGTSGSLLNSFTGTYIPGGDAVASSLTFSIPVNTIPSSYPQTVLLAPGVSTSLYGRQYNGGATGASLTFSMLIDGNPVYLVTPNP